MLLGRRAAGLGVGIAALTALAGAAVWGSLPAEMAIHFSASGTPDNYVPKAVGVGLLPAVMLGTLLLVEGALRADPSGDPGTAAVVTVATLAFMAAIHGVVLAWNLGHAVDFDLVLVGTLAWAGAVVGYALKRERGSVV